MAVHKRILQPGQRIRVMVVDDSAVIRRLVTLALSDDSAIEVVGTASNGIIGLQRIPQWQPDVLTLDVEMPEMNGLQMLRQLRLEYPQLRVIMFSTMTGPGAAITMDALSLGADDYVTKASNEGSLDRSMARLRQELLPRIKQFFQSGSQSGEPVPCVPPLSTRSQHQTGATNHPKAVLIGVSTGGPKALAEIVPNLPRRFPLPVLVVQHMPPMFTRLLAERLNAHSSLPVREAVNGEPVESGEVLIAPGDFHLKLSATAGAVRVCLDQSPPQNSCRPAVDALFASAADAYQGSVIAAVLTGMGQDGLRGARILKAAGATLIAQDEASSVVWGMPGAVANAGLCDAVLPLDQMAAELLRRAKSN